MTPGWISGGKVLTAETENRTRSNGASGANWCRAEASLPLKRVWAIAMPMTPPVWPHKRRSDQHAPLKRARSGRTSWKKVTRLVA